MCLRRTVSDIVIIKELRELTNLSVQDIRKALAEAGGNKDQALELLRTRGAAIAQKKSIRTTHEGIVEAYIHATKKVGVLMELQCETDFVARNPLFSELAHDLAMHIAAMDPTDEPSLLGQLYIKDQSITIKDLMTGVIAKLGENIKLGKFVRYSLSQ